MPHPNWPPCNHQDPKTPFFWMFPYPPLQPAAPVATGPPEHLPLGSHHSSIHPP